MQQPKLITVRGDYSSMGVEYGRLARDAVGQNLDFYQRIWTDHAGIPSDGVLSWGDVFAEQVRAYNADIADLVEGVAEGAGVDRRLIFALNAKLELMYGSGYTDCACTSLAVLDSRTTNRHTLVAQNWDWHPDVGPNTVLLSTTDTDGFEVLTLTEAGQVGKSGLNSCGIGVCANLLVSGRDAAGHGVPYAILLRGVLQSQTMSDAIRAVTTPTRISSGNFMIAARGGEAIDIECAPDDFGHLVPHNGLVAHANHFETDVIGRDVEKSAARLTLLRAERVRHLLEDALDQRIVDADRIHAVLSDHFSYPDGLCRHVNPATAPAEHIVSAYSLIMDLDELTMAVTPFPVCESAAVSYALTTHGPGGPA